MLTAKTSLFDAYEAFGGIDRESPERYGLYKACTERDLMQECAEYLPYCANAEEADKMAAICQQEAG